MFVSMEGWIPFNLISLANYCHLQAPVGHLWFRGRPVAEHPKMTDAAWQSAKALEANDSAVVQQLVQSSQHLRFSNKQMFGRIQRQATLDSLETYLISPWPGPSKRPKETVMPMSGAILSPTCVVHLSVENVYLYQTP